jgi:serine/threonine protein kinase
MVNYLHQRFGNYVLLKLIGRGGFANVYLGRHIYLRTYAAIKVMRTSLVEMEYRNFLREAQIVASLEHRHIVRIHDYGVKAGIPYLVMNYTPHGSLRKQHPQGTRLPVETIVDYVQQLAEALEYIHSQELVHRDVKPENILLGRNGEILLSDFGIAIVAQRATPTSMHDFTGSFSYTAPERFQGYAFPASDQYALGVVVYEWLTGERPFRGSPEQIIRQHLYISPPPLRVRFPDIPLEIEHVLFKSLKKDPRGRYASVQDFADALNQAVYPPSSLPEVKSQVQEENNIKVYDNIGKFFLYDVLATITLSIILYVCGMMPNSIIQVFGACLLILPIISAIAQKNWYMRIIAVFIAILSGIVGILAHSIQVLSVIQLSLLIYCSVVASLLKIFKWPS